MRVLLVTLCLLAMGAEKPVPPPEKASPTQPRKRRTTPTPHLPAAPKPAEKLKTAMA
jgi:hypothetical protein